MERCFVTHSLPLYAVSCERWQGADGCWLYPCVLVCSSGRGVCPAPCALARLKRLLLPCQRCIRTTMGSSVFTSSIRSSRCARSLLRALAKCRASYWGPTDDSSPETHTCRLTLLSSLRPIPPVAPALNDAARVRDGSRPAGRRARGLPLLAVPKTDARETALRKATRTQCCLRPCERFRASDISGRSAPDGRSSESCEQLPLEGHRT